jgi:hypothetical protein
VEGNLGASEPNPVGPVLQAVLHRLSPVLRWTREPAGGRGGDAAGAGLTLLKDNAYRWPVTRCRRVPHVHGLVTRPWVGGASRKGVRFEREPDVAPPIRPA